jgi:hypothetical protein
LKTPSVKRSRFMTVEVTGCAENPPYTRCVAS